MLDSVAIFPVNQQHLEGCLELINELALYEKAPQEVEVDLQTLQHDFEAKRFEAFVAIKNQEVVGMALYYGIYSTWKGYSLHLEDIVVQEAQRRKGIGAQLFDAVVAEAKRRKAGRMQWLVLEWNEPAIAFYKKYHAQFEDDWHLAKLTKAQISQ